MTRTQRFTGLGIVLVAALGLGYAGWSARSRSQMAVCELSGRPIHPNMRTVALIGNSRKVLCCPTCALSAGAQTHQTVRFEKLSDYETARPLRPEDAYAVEGSDVIPCDLPHALTTTMLNQDGQPIPVAFDRCSPSILTFASRESAERFASEHGGKVDSFVRITSQPLPSGTY